MKDVRTVLLQKEQDLERVRQEVHALIRVIPLLMDDAASGTGTSPSRPWSVQEVPASAVPGDPTHADNELAELERFYPFVRHMSRNSR
jgi:hypothetical protein